MRTPTATSSEPHKTTSVREPTPTSNVPSGDSRRKDQRKQSKGKGKKTSTMNNQGQEETFFLFEIYRQLNGIYSKSVWIKYRALAARANRRVKKTGQPVHRSISRT